jgi:Mg2+-importing ATPase
VAEVRRFMVVFGLLSTAFDLATFWLLLRVYAADQATFQTVWFVVSLLTELAVLLVLRTTGVAWRSVPGRWLLVVTGAVAGIAVAVPWLGAPAALFGFVPLSPALAGASLAIVAGYVLATEATMAWFYRGAPRAARAGP